MKQKDFIFCQWQYNPTEI